MTNLQVRNVPPEIMDALRAEAEQHDRSLQQQVLSVLDEHTARARRRLMLERLDEALGDAPVLDVDAADAIRADRDDRDARDAQRAHGAS